MSWLDYPALLSGISSNASFKYNILQKHNKICKKHPTSSDSAMLVRDHPPAEAVGGLEPVPAQLSQRRAARDRPPPSGRHTNSPRSSTLRPPFLQVQRGPAGAFRGETQGSRLRSEASGGVFFAPPAVFGVSILMAPLRGFSGVSMKHPDWGSW